MCRLEHEVWTQMLFGLIWTSRQVTSRSKTILIIITNSDQHSDVRRWTLATLVNDVERHQSICIATSHWTLVIVRYSYCILCRYCCHSLKDLVVVVVVELDPISRPWTFNNSFNKYYRHWTFGHSAASS